MWCFILKVWVEFCSGDISYTRVSHTGANIAWRCEVWRQGGFIFSYYCTMCDFSEKINTSLGTRSFSISRIYFQLRCVLAARCRHQAPTRNLWRNRFRIMAARVDSRMRSVHTEVASSSLSPDVLSPKQSLFTSLLTMISALVSFDSGRWVAWRCMIQHIRLNKAATFTHPGFRNTNTRQTQDIWTEEVRGGVVYLENISSRKWWTCWHLTYKQTKSKWTGVKMELSWQRNII